MGSQTEAHGRCGKAADRAILLGGPAQYHFDWQFRRTGRLGVGNGAWHLKQ